MDLAALLRQQRINHGYSQNALAKMIGVSQPHINDMEHGHVKPSLDVLERLCAVLDLELIVRPIQNKPE